MKVNSAHSDLTRGAKVPGEMQTPGNDERVSLETPPSTQSFHQWSSFDTGTPMNFPAIEPSSQKMSLPVGSANLWVGPSPEVAQATIDSTKPIVEAPVIRPLGKTVSMSPDDIVAMSKDLLTKQLVTQNFDSVAFGNQFLDFVKTAPPELTPQQAVRTWKPDSIATIAKYGGAHCVGQSLHIVACLRNRGIHAFTVPSYCVKEFSSSQPYTHTAAMVKFQEPTTSKTGYVLLDPGLNFDKPVVILPGETTSMRVGGNDWTFSINEDGNLTAKKIGRDSGVEERIFLFAEWTNPEKALTASAPFGLPKGSGKHFIAVREADGNVTTAVRVDLHKQNVILGIGADKRVYTFEQAEEQLRRNITPEFAQQFGTSPEVLGGRVMQIVRNGDFLLAAVK